MYPASTQKCWLEGAQSGGLSPRRRARREGREEEDEGLLLLACDSPLGAVGQSHWSFPPPFTHFLGAPSARDRTRRWDQSGRRNRRHRRTRGYLSRAAPSRCAPLLGPRGRRRARAGRLAEEDPPGSRGWKTHDGGSLEPRVERPAPHPNGHAAAASAQGPGVPYSVGCQECQARPCAGGEARGSAPNPEIPPSAKPDRHHLGRLRLRVNPAGAPRLRFRSFRSNKTPRDPSASEPFPNAGATRLQVGAAPTGSGVPAIWHGGGSGPASSRVRPIPRRRRPEPGDPQPSRAPGVPSFVYENGVSAPGLTLQKAGKHRVGGFRTPAVNDAKQVCGRPRAPSTLLGAFPRFLRNPPATPQRRRNEQAARLPMWGGSVLRTLSPKVGRGCAMAHCVPRGGPQPLHSEKGKSKIRIIFWASGFEFGPEPPDRSLPYVTRSFRTNPHLTKLTVLFVPASPPKIPVSSG